MSLYTPTAQKSHGKYIAVAISPSGCTQRLGKNAHLTEDGRDTRNAHSGQRRFDDRDQAIAFAKQHTDLWNSRMGAK